MGLSLMARLHEAGAAKQSMGQAQRISVSMPQVQLAGGAAAAQPVALGAPSRRLCCAWTLLLADDGGGGAAAADGPS